LITEVGVYGPVFRADHQVIRFCKQVTTGQDRLNRIAGASLDDPYESRGIVVDVDKPCLAGPRCGDEDFFYVIPVRITGE
jgi:hypothetical protein